MSEEKGFSRRDLLRNIGISMTVGSAGSALLSAQDAHHVHELMMEEKVALPVGSEYKPKYFNPHEYATLRRLAELIVPADGRSRGALEAGAPEFIDFLCSHNQDLANIYTGGIGWLDQQMQHRHAADFVDANPEQQTAMLDMVAYRRNESPELGPGIHFFDWVRKMVVDAYVTSPVGFDDLNYMGNKVLSQFSVPKSSLDYALKRSPV